MSGVLDYNYVNTLEDRKFGKKRFVDGVKNQSSVGNPILTEAEAARSNRIGYQTDAMRRV